MLKKPAEAPKEKSGSSRETAPPPPAGAAARRAGGQAPVQEKEKMAGSRSEEAKPRENNGEGVSGGFFSALKQSFGSASSGNEKAQPSPEGQALNDLDRYGDVYDNPGGGDPDGKISTDDLEDVAGGDYDRQAAAQRLKDLGVRDDQINQTFSRLQTSASYLLDQDGLRNQLDVANDDGGPDGTISRGDVSRFMFERQKQDGFQAGPSASNRDQSNDGVFTEDERTPEIIQRQEQAVLDAVTSGQPVKFTNANGQSEELSIRQLQDSGGLAAYELTGEDGRTVRIESELGASENRTGLARLADYYTEVPRELRESADKFELLRGRDDDGAAASFNSDSDRIRFFSGLNNLNEEVFDHELGHGVGYEKDGLGEGFFDEVGQIFSGSDGKGAPSGWLDAIESDNRRISDYAKTNHKEDFSENWAAYMEAREQGPQALQELRERFPARFAVMERIYNEG